jgi:hypothetical protein
MIEILGIVRAHHDAQPVSPRLMEKSLQPAEEERFIHDKHAATNFLKQSFLPKQVKVFVQRTDIVTFPMQKTPFKH